VDTGTFLGVVSKPLSGIELRSSSKELVALLTDAHCLDVRITVCNSEGILKPYA
jgi:hypothetical protein